MPRFYMWSGKRQNRHVSRLPRRQSTLEVVMVQGGLDALRPLVLRVVHESADRIRLHRRRIIGPQESPSPPVTTPRGSRQSSPVLNASTACSSWTCRAVNRKTGSGASPRGTTASIPGSPGPTTPSGPVPRSRAAVGSRPCSTCHWSKPPRTSYPWPSLRATRSSRFGSGLPAGASRRIGRACTRGWRWAVGGGDG